MKDFVHVDMLRWLLEARGLRISVALLRFELAASPRHLMQVLTYLGDFGLRHWSPFAVSDAAGAGFLDAVQWLSRQLPSHSTTSPVVTAAANGHWHVVEWLLDHTAFATAGAMLVAAASGHIRIVKRLYKRGIVDDMACVKQAAAIGGHLPTLMWLVSVSDRGCLRCVVRIMLDDATSVRAACDSLAKCSVQQLHDYQAPVLNTLQWLRAHCERIAPCGSCQNREPEVAGDRLACIAARLGDAQLLASLHLHFRANFWWKTESPLEIADHARHRGCMATVETIFSLFQQSVNWESMLVKIAETPGCKLSMEALVWLKTHARNKARWQTEYLVQLALRDFRSLHG